MLQCISYNSASKKQSKLAVWNGKSTVCLWLNSSQGDLPELSAKAQTSQSTMTIDSRTVNCQLFEVGHSYTAYFCSLSRNLLLIIQPLPEPLSFQLPFLKMTQRVDLNHTLLQTQVPWLSNMQRFSKFQASMVFCFLTNFNTKQLDGFVTVASSLAGFIFVCFLLLPQGIWRI